MKELLSAFLGAGLPAYSALAGTVFAVVLWRYFEHRLELERNKSAKELEMIHAAYQDRFKSVDVIFSHLAELVHNVHAFPDKQDRKARIEDECQFLRHFVREKEFVLGKSLQPPIYAVTDYARDVTNGTSEFDETTLWGLSEVAHKALRDVADSIPQLKNAMPK